MKVSNIRISGIHMSANEDLDISPSTNTLRFQELPGTKQTLSKLHPNNNIPFNKIKPLIHNPHHI